MRSNARDRRQPVARALPTRKSPLGIPLGLCLSLRRADLLKVVAVAARLRTRLGRSPAARTCTTWLHHFRYRLELRRKSGRRALRRGQQEFLENASVERRGGIALRMKLSSNREPILATRFDRFDDPIRAARRHPESRCDFIDRHVMHAVDANFSVAVDPSHDRAGHDLEPVTMRRILWDRDAARRWASPPECAGTSCRPARRSKAACRRRSRTWECACCANKSASIDQSLRAGDPSA